MSENTDILFLALDQFIFMLCTSQYSLGDFPALNHDVTVLFNTLCVRDADFSRWVGGVEEIKR